MYDPTQNDFYIVLPSNVANIAGSAIENKPNYYRTVLPRPFELDHPQKWEVALSGINYPQTFNTTVNLKQCAYSFARRRPSEAFIQWLDNRSRRLVFGEGPDSEETKQSRTETHFVRRKFRQETVLYQNCAGKSKKKKNESFTDIQQLMDWLNETRPTDMRGKFALTDDGHVSVQLASKEILYLHRNLASVLGFKKDVFRGKDASDSSSNTPVAEPNQRQNEDHFERKFRLLLQNYRRMIGKTYNPTLLNVKAESLADLRLNCYNIYVYSNLVRQTLVGDVQVPLLRTVPIDKENDGKYIGLSFDRLRFRPLSSNFFEYIDIKLTDDLGEDLEFKSGKVIVTLYIRQRRD